MKNYNNKITDKSINCNVTLIKGFTILELLMVIATIVILTALLLPALKQAKEISKSTCCKSNLKQIAICTFNYSDDNQGYFAPPSSGGDYWWHFYSSYCPLTIMKCPSHDYVEPDNRKFSYAYNASIPRILVKMNRAKPGKVIWCDASYIYIASDSIAGYYYYQSKIGAWHLSKANYCFLDGHIEELRYIVVYGNYNYFNPTN